MSTKSAMKYVRMLSDYSLHYPSDLFECWAPAAYVNVNKRK